MKLKIFCAVACFLPGRAKDLSAPLYKKLFTVIKKILRKNRISDKDDIDSSRISIIRSMKYKDITKHVV